MVEFDPSQAALAYASLDVEDLVRIAYLDPDYIEEAKELARAELDRRGLPMERSALVERTRKYFELRSEAVEIANYEGMAKVERIKFRIATYALIGILWFFALFPIPLLPSLESPKVDWRIAWLPLVWLIVSAYSVREKLRGKPRLFYLVLVIPAALYILGAAYRKIL